MIMCKINERIIYLMRLIVLVAEVENQHILKVFLISSRNKIDELRAELIKPHAQKYANNMRMVHKIKIMQSLRAVNCI